MRQSDHSSRPDDLRIIRARDIRNQSEALKVNQEIAYVLAPARPHLAARLARCGPGYRCSQSRLCALCGWAREQRLVRRHALRISRHAGPFRHVTLNTYPTDTLTRQVIQRVLDAFKTVRQQRAFRRAVLGGVLSVHIVYRRAWKVHIHALLILSPRSAPNTLTTSSLRRAWAEEEMGTDVELKPLKPNSERRVVAYGARWQGVPLDAELLRQLAWAPHSMSLTRAWGAATALYGRPRTRRRPRPT